MGGKLGLLNACPERLPGTRASPALLETAKIPERPYKPFVGTVGALPSSWALCHLLMVVGQCGGGGSALLPASPAAPSPPHSPTRAGPLGSQTQPGTVPGVCKWW